MAEMVEMEAMYISVQLAACPVFTIWGERIFTEIMANMAR
jgi:hypothetical protein